MAPTTRVVFSSGTVPFVDRPMAVIEITPPQPNQALYRGTVLMLDCSGSMWDSLESVKSDARKFVAKLDESNHVSVIVFSGHGRAQLLAGPVQCKDSGKRQLDQAISSARIMDTTVFSEPLELVLRHLRTTRIDGMASQAVLFTDGCAVPTMWGVATEEQRALDATRALYEYGAAVSVIGYGAHYDDDFVRRIMRAGGHTGIFRHMSDVEDFGVVIRDIQDTFSRVDLSNISLTIQPSSGSVRSVIRTLPEVVELSTDGHLSVRGLYQGKLIVYVDLSGSANSVRIKGRIDDIEVDWAGDASPLSSDEQADCVRVVAANLAASGHAGEAAELFEQIGEEGVAERISNAFTHRDRRTTRDYCRSAFRTKRFIGAGLKASGPNHNVLNVLATLIDDPAMVISLPSGIYKRGGILKEEPGLISSPLGRTLEVISYTGHASRFNFSVTAKVPKKKLPLDGEGKPIPGGKPKDVFRKRTYNIVRDGELVMREIVASMSEDSFTKFQAAGVIADSETWTAGKSYTLQLGHLKMVSPVWARPGGLKLIETMQAIEELKVEQTALNAHIKALGGVPKDDNDDDHVDRPVVVEDAQTEYYWAPCMELKLLKYTPHNYTADVQQLDVFQANDRVKQVRQELRRLRFRARCVAYACEATGWRSVDWGTPKSTHRGRFPKQEYTCNFGGQQVRRVTWNEEVAFS